jgi:hypothetical protein
MGRTLGGYRTRCTGALSPSHEAAQNGKVGENTTPYFWRTISVEVVQICLQLEFCAARKKDRREVDFSSSLL